MGSCCSRLSGGSDGRQDEPSANVGTGALLTSSRMHRFVLVPAAEGFFLFAE
jgi:hypothetical protein